MSDHLVIGVLGLRSSGKSYTWDTLFGRKVRRGYHRLKLRRDEFVDTYLIAGSPEERNEKIKELLRGRKERVILCSVQYVFEAQETFNYFVRHDFTIYFQWLNPAHGRERLKAFDTLGFCNRILSEGTSTLAIRSGFHARSRVQEIREVIYGWARYRNLIHP